MAVNIFRDITEAKRAEDTLRRVTEAERSRIARDLHDGVLQDLSYTAAAMGLIMLEVDDAELERESSKQQSMPSGVALRASVRRSTTCASKMKKIDPSAS
jgi:signal transduction histidine kinase